MQSHCSPRVGGCGAPAALESLGFSCAAMKCVVFVYYASWSCSSRLASYCSSLVLPSQYLPKSYACKQRTSSYPSPSAVQPVGRSVGRSEYDFLCKTSVLHIQQQRAVFQLRLGFSFFFSSFFLIFSLWL